MGVLDGVKVLEVAEHGFVPSAATILGEWGADVVKVERPTGDPLRGIQAMGLVADTGDFNFLFEQFNRNKRGIALDLRSEGGRRALDRLIERADVFITNFLPSARKKLRLDPEDVQKVNDRCVYAIGSGQGLEGPDAEMGGFDAVSFWARGGIGHMLSPKGGPLVQPRGAFGDAPSGAYLAGGVAAALFQRERTGKASVVDVSLLGAAVWTLSVDLVPTSILEADPEPHSPGRSLASVLVGSYRTNDGRWLSLNMLDPERHWEPTCRALGLEHLLERDDLATAVQRAKAKDELFPMFTEAIASMTLAELKVRLGAQDTIWSSMASPMEVIDDPQVEANGYMPRYPGHDRARLTSAPVQFDGRGLEIRRGAPKIGEHTDEVLHEAGMTDDEIAALRGDGAAV
ncbi:MAG: putative Formyl-CoA transferase [Actinomycetia bacterium]|jgi:crotonobetainyl-CoA:carnitine CoA-transferase CaiB-like acyl-CoA transferase|nr:putative Formyl-CoA transferase [Actinomycetes bacterium]